VPVFPELTQIIPGLQVMTSWILQHVLQAGCPSCSPTNSIKALKELLTVSDIE